MPRKKHISKQLRLKVAQAANHRCGYCLFPQKLMGMPLTIEHIQPEAAGGATNEENLWLACRRCNDRKGTRTTGIDPQTGQEHPLFNPREQDWWKHFAWSEDGTEIMGKTACGRVTILTLHLNNPEIVTTRAMWVSAGWWPPQS